MAHALTAHAGECHFDAAAVADDALVLDALVFAAGTLPVTGTILVADFFWSMLELSTGFGGTNGFGTLDFTGSAPSSIVFSNF